MKENRIDHELWEMEDGFVEDQIHAVEDLVNAQKRVEIFSAQNPERGFHIQVKSPGGEIFMLDILPIIPMVLLNVAFEHYKMVKDTGQEVKMEQRAKALKSRWEQHPHYQKPQQK